MVLNITDPGSSSREASKVSIVKLGCHHRYYLIGCLSEQGSCSEMCGTDHYIVVYGVDLSRNK